MNETSATATLDGRPAAPHAWRRLIVVLVLLGGAGAGLVAFHRFKAGVLKQVSAAIVAQLPTVATATATVTDWQSRLTATGTLRASDGADLAAELPGIVEQIMFKSGDEVAAGTLLLRLRGNDDEAKLAQLQATADLAATTYQRDLVQLRAQGVAQATVDTDAGNLKSARAQVAAQRALMDEKLVRAPFAGRLGLRQVDQGQYLAAGTTIVTLQALDPIFVDFHVPQQALGQLRVGQAVSLRVDAYPGRRFAASIVALDAKADASSRMMQVRAALANADHALLPGTYATVEVDVGAVRREVTVPGTAITYNPYGSTVYKLVQDGTDDGGKPRMVARQEFVTTGDTRGDQVAILKGVAAADVVVTAGQLKLRNNSAVRVNNAVLPSNDPAPAPTIEQQ